MKTYLTLLIFILMSFFTKATDEPWVKFDQYNSLHYGVFNNYDNTGNSVLSIVCIDEDFNNVWNQSLDLPFFLFYGIKVNPSDNSLFVFGHNENIGFSGTNNGILIKLDLNGNLIWLKAIEELGDDKLKSLAVFSDGSILCGLNSNSFSATTAPIMTKLDANGNNLNLTKRIQTSAFSNFDLVELTVNSNDEVFVLANLTAAGIRYGAVLKFDANLNLLASQTFTMNDDDFFTKNIIALENEIVICSRYEIVSGTETDVMIHRYDNNLQEIDVDGFVAVGRNIPISINETDNFFIVELEHEYDNFDSWMHLSLMHFDKNWKLLNSRIVDGNHPRATRLGFINESNNENNLLAFKLETDAPTLSPVKFGVNNEDVCLTEEQNFTQVSAGLTNVPSNFSLNNESFFIDNYTVNENLLTVSIDAICSSGLYPFFETNLDDSCTANQVSFSMPGSQSYSNVSWNFGDGNTSTDINPTHTYNNIGNYIVNLTVTDANGNTDYYNEIISVNSIGPTLSISGLPSTVSNSQAIALTGSPTGGVFSGNGVVFNSFNPSIAGPGFHEVVYSFTDSDGCTFSVSEDVLVFSVNYNFVQYNLGTINP